MPELINHSHYTLLVIDDDPETTFVLEEFLFDKGYTVFTANSAHIGQEIFNNYEIDLVLLDINMPKISGTKLLEIFKDRKPEVVVIMISAIHDVDIVVKCIKNGAYDYFVKPIFELNQINVRIECSLSENRLRIENKILRQRLFGTKKLNSIIASSSQMKSIIQSVKNVAQYNSTVFITGPSGTGKELIARTIHELSDRYSKPFVAINCGSIQESLLESTLFGHEKGTFTGATAQHKGLFEESNTGTIFLDEITETSKEFQVRLLRVLEDNFIRRVGGDKEIKLDLRIIAATNTDIEKKVKSKDFREDLYYRLNVFRISIPPLRERKEDIPLLVNHFLYFLAEKLKKEPPQISKEVHHIFYEYPWAGNVRELINVLENTIISCKTNIIKPQHLPDEVKTYFKNHPLIYEPHSFHQSMQKFEYEYFSKLLSYTEGNITKAAKIAGFSRPHLHVKLNSIGLKR